MKTLLHLLYLLDLVSVVFGLVGDGKSWLAIAHSWMQLGFLRQFDGLLTALKK
jgi:hypothetical protein